MKPLQTYTALTKKTQVQLNPGFFIDKETASFRVARKFLILIALLLNTLLMFSQGTIRGNISDENGETLTGATIVLKTNNSVATISDFDGNYSLRIPASGPQVIQITFIGYKTLEDTVLVESGKIAVYDYV
jgi:hypothetical protein